MSHDCRGQELKELGDSCGSVQCFQGCQQGSPGSVHLAAGLVCRGQGGLPPGAGTAGRLGSAGSPSSPRGLSSTTVRDSKCKLPASEAWAWEPVRLLPLLHVPLVRAASESARFQREGAQPPDSQCGTIQARGAIFNAPHLPSSLIITFFIRLESGSRDRHLGPTSPCRFP